MIRVDLPLRLVSPNATLREHWTVKAKRRASERGIARAHLFALCAGHRQNGMLGPLANRLNVTLTRFAPRAFDSDNVQGAFKSVRDGVADALGVKDNDLRIAWVYKQAKSKLYGIRIEIEVKE